MISTFKQFAIAKWFYDADKSFEARKWREAANKYSEIAAQLKSNSKSLASAKVLARLSICHFSLNEMLEARRIQLRLEALAKRIDISSEDRRWLVLYTEYLGQILGSDTSELPQIQDIALHYVSDRLKEDFPLSDLQELARK